MALTRRSVTYAQHSAHLSQQPTRWGRWLTNILLLQMQWYVVETATCFSLMPPASFVPNETKRDDDLASHAIYPCKPEQRTRWKVLPVQGSGEQNCLLPRDGVTERKVAAGMREIVITLTNVTSRLHWHCVAHPGAIHGCLL